MFKLKDKQQLNLIYSGSFSYMYCIHVVALYNRVSYVNIR